MGILAAEKSQASPVAQRRKSAGLDFSSLKPLNAASGTKNFGGYRESVPSPKKKDTDAMDSDADDEDEDKAKNEEVDEDKDLTDKGMLSPEDALRQGELAEGVRKIKVRGDTTKLFVAVFITNSCFSSNANTPPSP
jgi:hypothetical protein